MNDSLAEGSNNGRLWNGFHIGVALLAVMASLLYFVSPPRYLAILSGYIQPLVVAAAAVTLYRFHGAKQPELRLMAVYAAWLVVTRVLNGDHYLEAEYADVNAQLLCSFVLLPAAFLLDEARRMRALKWLCALVGGLLSAIAWVAVAGALRGKPFVNPIAGNVLGINDTYSGPYRLNVFDMHPNMSALLFFLAFFLLLTLLCGVKRKAWAALILPACAGLYLAVALTLSRTVMIAFSFALALLALMLGMRGVRPPARAAKAAALAVLMLGVGVGTYFSFSLALKAMTAVAGRVQAADTAEAAEVAETTEQADASVSAFVDTRNQAENFKTLTGRTDIWATFVPTLKDSPKKILIGSPADTLIRFQERALGRKLVHMHNLFLQTFLYVGLPGFLLACGFLALLVTRMLRLFFCQDPGVTLAMKMPILTVSGLLLCAMVEQCVFAPDRQSNLLFFLLAGFILSCSYRYCPFKRGARRGMR